LVEHARRHGSAGVLNLCVRESESYMSV
jgi:hypothetical protein